MLFTDHSLFLINLFSNIKKNKIIRSSIYKYQWVGSGTMVGLEVVCVRVEVRECYVTPNGILVYYAGLIWKDWKIKYSMGKLK